MLTIKLMIQLSICQSIKFLTHKCYDIYGFLIFENTYGLSIEQYLHVFTDCINRTINISKNDSIFNVIVM